VGFGLRFGLRIVVALALSFALGLGFLGFVLVGGEGSSARSSGSSPGIGSRFSRFLLAGPSTGLARATENRANNSMRRKARILDLCDGASWEGK
jgi:hypothetical protein